MHCRQLQQAAQKRKRGKNNRIFEDVFVIYDVQCVTVWQHLLHENKYLFDAIRITFLHL